MYPQRRFSLSDETKNGSRRTYSVPALDKGLDILEALSQTAVPQTMADLTRLCKRSRSEIFRMVDALERRSYISRDPISGAYQLTLKLYQLAHTHSPIDALLKAAYYPMRALAESLKESCHLCILEEGRVLVVAAADSPMPVRLSVEVGYTASPLSTVSGRLLMSVLDDSERDRALKADSEFAAMSRRAKTELLSRLEIISKKGALMMKSSKRIGIDVSCLVGDPKVGVSAALGVPFLGGGPSHGKEASLIPVIKSFADQITKRMGLGIFAEVLN